MSLALIWRSLYPRMEYGLWLCLGGSDGCATSALHIYVLNESSNHFSTNQTLITESSGKANSSVKSCGCRFYPIQTHPHKAASNLSVSQPRIFNQPQSNRRSLDFPSTVTTLVEGTIILPTR